MMTDGWRGLSGGETDCCGKKQTGGIRALGSDLGPELCSGIKPSGVFVSKRTLHIPLAQTHSKEYLHLNSYGAVGFRTSLGL